MDNNLIECNFYLFFLCLFRVKNCVDVDNNDDTSALFKLQKYTQKRAFTFKKTKTFLLKSDKKVFSPTAAEHDLTEVYKVMSLSSLLHDFIKHLWGQKLYAYFVKLCKNHNKYTFFPSNDYNLLSMHTESPSN